jgi:[protein-PII] uridylyltransferase
VSERPAPVGRLLEGLRSLDRAYSTGHHGRWSGRRRAELVDACLRDLAATAGMPEDVALVALGGYGRGTLAPGSDLDLLILHEGSADAVSLLAERLLYPLWDAGLRVGHAVRTPEVCVEIAAERLDATTAMLGGRLLAGSAPGWDEVRSAVLESVRGDPPAFAQRLVADRDARRERFGSVSSLLEPELKEGVGGLRDVHALGWVRTAIGRPLEEAGILREAERRSVDGAEEFLTRVRSALHLETGRGSDRLLAEQQPSIAAAMGFADEPGLPAVDGLMRSVFEQARQVEHVTASVFDRFLRGTSLPQPLDATPEGVLRAFASSARDGHVMPAASLDAMSAVAIDADRPWTGPTRTAFLELLRFGPAAVDAL